MEAEAAIRYSGDRGRCDVLSVLRGVLGLVHESRGLFSSVTTAAVVGGRPAHGKSDNGQGGMTVKAQSLSVNLNVDCNAHCPFCISKLTWKPGASSAFKVNEDLGLSIQRLETAMQFACYHGVDTVLVTGVGEPMRNMQAIGVVAKTACDAGIPIIEVQTNGTYLSDEVERMVENPFGDRYATDQRQLVSRGKQTKADVLAAMGVTTVAISICSMDPERNSRTMGLHKSIGGWTYDWRNAAQAVLRAGMMCRVSLNLTKQELEHVSLPELTHWVQGQADLLRELGVHQFTMRQIGFPSVPVYRQGLSTELAGDGEPGRQFTAICHWIEKNMLDEVVHSFISREIADHGTMLRPLSYGGAIYDYRGVSMVVTDCMTETKSDEVRSLIFQPDQHLYHSWVHRGSIIL